MQLIKRDSKQILKWWYSLDHLILVSVFFLLLIGSVMSVSISPVVAERIGVSKDFFYKKHFIYASIFLPITLFITIIPRYFLIKISKFALGGCFFLLVLVLFEGDSLKGAKRWLDLFGFTLQPSEVTKPFFIIVIAYLFAQAREKKDRIYLIYAILILLALLFLLFNQPDFGMVINYSVIWGAILYIFGVPKFVLISLSIFAIGGVFFAYNFLAHVKYRIDSFIFSAENMSYQVRKSLEAISNGGWFGQGIGEGYVKNHLPDAHTDFIFAAMVEELGFIAIIVVLLLYLVIIYRSVIILKTEKNYFVTYAALGLGIQFAFQVVTNIGVNLNLLPTKGTTLPLISYGGSSMLTMAMILGFILLFTREKYGKIEKSQL